MQSGWEKAEYEIQMQQDGRIYAREVHGIIKGGFGIHETAAGWNITHVASGWNCFTGKTEEAARIIARYLTENYDADFSRLKVSGTELENFKTLLEKIESDVELREMIRLFGAEIKKNKEEKPSVIELTILS